LEASKILKIQLMDRVIIGQPVNGNQGYFSFKEGGLIG
jgi:DNA repair protein RadC